MPYVVIPIPMMLPVKSDEIMITFQTNDFVKIGKSIDLQKLRRKI